MRKIVLSLIVMLAAVFSAKALVYTVVVPEGTKACYIAGSMTGWKQVEMEQDADEPTIFTIDLPEATKADVYKYCCGPGWAWVEKSATGGEIDDRNYPDDGMNIDFVEIWALEYDPELDKEFTFNVTVPEGTITVFVNGSFNNWSGFEELEKLTETTYTLTVRVIGSESVNYKYASGPSWDYEELREDGSRLPVDRNLAEPESDDVVAMWRAIYDPDEEIEENEFTLFVTVPEGTEACYVAGSMNDWKPEPMEKVTVAASGALRADGLGYTITYTFAANSIAYKYLSGPDWKYEEIIAADRVLAAADSPAQDIVADWKEVYTPSGLINVNVDKSIIIASKAAITVQLAGTSTVEVYTVYGALLNKTVASGIYTHAGLPAGIYVVKINNKAYKALVK